jgi:AcrR family transcriptional regulator
MTSTPTGSSGRRRRRARGEGALLQGEILDAAVAVISRAGDADAMSIRALANEVGVTAPSIYRHFTDKAAILRAVLARSFRQFEEHLEAAAAGSGTPFARLQRRSLAYLQFADQQPGQYRLLFSAASLGPRQLGLDGQPHPGAGSYQALVDSVEACVRAGARPDGPSAQVALQLWSTLHGYADLKIGKPELTWPPYPMLVSNLLRSLKLDRAA